jgi:acid phosphatase (class A)
MGAGFDLKALPATAKLMSEVRHEEKIAADTAKTHFARKRPWIVDPSFKSCSRADEPLSSYPSGHATMGFSMAVVLADLAPEKAEALLARANDYGYSRMVCAMHFRADIVAGQVLGTKVAEDLLRKPAFRAERDAAADELRGAGLIP